MPCGRCGRGEREGTCGRCLDKICACGWCLRVTLTIVGFLMVLGGLAGVWAGARSDDDVLASLGEFGGGGVGVLGGLLMALPNCQRDGGGQMDDFERRLALLERGEETDEESFETAAESFSGGSTSRADDTSGGDEEDEGGENSGTVNIHVAKDDSKDSSK